MESFIYAACLFMAAVNITVFVLLTVSGKRKRQSLPPHIINTNELDKL